MDKLIGVWNYNPESLSGPLQAYGVILILILVFCVGVLFVSLLLDECSFRMAVHFSFGISIPILVGSGSVVVLVIEAIIYLASFVLYKMYYFGDAYEKLNLKQSWSNASNMDFQTFKNLYDLNLDRFGYTYDGHWEYHIPWSKEEKMNNCCRVGDNFYYITSQYKGTVYILITNPKEFVKYYKWNKQRLKQKAKDDAIKENAERYKNNVKSMQRILDQAQKDIDALKKQADEEINMAADISKQVKERIELS